ncbi:hypothetical protein OSB04_019298 [Centaurea solstitialis]|uniref:Uncharacterized protein n=1 Tax=Centaurea solstitialis TaxID=347529 RepID=A0AA38WC91_9ASTR|nr:hypothetical protein OSB04_019298 [Centaurea solstitialis]
MFVNQRKRPACFCRLKTFRKRSYGLRISSKTKSSKSSPDDPHLNGLLGEFRDVFPDELPNHQGTLTMKQYMEWEEEDKYIEFLPECEQNQEEEEVAYAENDANLIIKLNWLDDSKGLNVKMQALVSFSIGNYKEELWCDVIPMSACHLFFGRPWEFDRKVIHEGDTNIYSVKVGNKRITLQPLSPNDYAHVRESKRKASLFLSAKYFEKEVVWLTH